MCYSRVFWVAKIVAKIMWTRVLHWFCNPSCKTYIGTGTCDLYHDPWSRYIQWFRLFFHDFEVTFATRSCKNSCKTSMIFATLQLTCDLKRDLWNQSRGCNTRRREIVHSIEAWGEWKLLLTAYVWLIYYEEDVIVLARWIKYSYVVGYV